MDSNMVLRNKKSPSKAAPVLGKDGRIDFMPLGTLRAHYSFKLVVDERGIHSVRAHQGAIEFFKADGTLHESIQVLDSPQQESFIRPIKRTTEKGKMIVTGEIRVEKELMDWEGKYSVLDSQ